MLLTTAPSCLRALFPTQSPAIYSSDAAFCATYTTTVNTKTSGFPTRATAACGTATSRYSSACSCKPTITSTPTCTPTPANNIVKNGGFECGLSPWIATDSSNSTHSISTPGDASNSAYLFTSGPVSEETFSDPANVRQDLALRAGAEYELRFRSFFNQCPRGEIYIGVFLNGRNIYQIDSCAHGGVAGQFFDNTVVFTAETSVAYLRFEFISTEITATAKIDNVVMLL